MKKKIGKFILQSLIIFLIWFAGQEIIYILKFENENTVSTLWLVVVIIMISIFRYIKSEKNDNDDSEA